MAESEDEIFLVKRAPGQGLIAEGGVQRVPGEYGWVPPPPPPMIGGAMS